MNGLVKIASVLSCRLAKESPSLLQHCLTPRWILSFSDTEGTLDMLLGLSSENSLQPGPTSIECGRGLWTAALVVSPVCLQHGRNDSSLEQHNCWWFASLSWMAVMRPQTCTWTASLSPHKAALTTAVFLLTRQNNSRRKWLHSLNKIVPETMT